MHYQLSHIPTREHSSFTQEMTDEEYESNVKVIPTKAKKIEKWVGALLRAAPKVKGANLSEAEVCCGVTSSTPYTLVEIGLNMRLALRCSNF